MSKNYYNCKKTLEQNTKLGKLRLGTGMGPFSAPSKAWTNNLAMIIGLLAFAAGVANAKVEFKHHNNTELAEVLQQVHNRSVSTSLLAYATNKCSTLN